MRSSTWRALGNTYAVVESEAPLDATRAAQLSERTDGVLEVLRHTHDRVEIAIWNPDGSRAELSGNGTRIAAAWLAERTSAHEIDVVVDGGRAVKTSIREGGLIEQNMGAVEVGPPETLEGVTFTPVSVGNPHAVVLGDPDEIVVLGPLLERHPRFPHGTNVQVARIEAPGVVSARVWERGVGETASSGTSAVAVAAATHGDGDVLVRFPGGELKVRLKVGSALLYGTVECLD